MCELGEHTIGLDGRKILKCRTQKDLIMLIVKMANEDLQGGASEPAAQVELLSGEYPTYAALRRLGSKLEVDNSGSISGWMEDEEDMLTARC